MLGRRAPLLASLALVCGCAQGGGLTDSGSPPRVDAGPVDAGLLGIDASARDAGSVALPDSGVAVDAGLRDAGSTSPDAGTDAGPPDVDAGPECTGPSDCDDLDVCTTDACSAGACTHTPVGVMGSDCAAPIDVSAGGTFSGDSTCANGDFAGVCNAGDAPDVHFTFTLSARADVTIDSLGTSYDAVLVFGTSCLGGELGCDDDSAGGGQSRITQTGLAAGTYHVVLDGKASSPGGAWTLNVAITTGPTMETVSFPEPSDSVSPPDGVLWVMGDYVEGTRSTSLPNATGASMQVTIRNNFLTCDTQDMRMLINGTEVGRFDIGPGASSVSMTYAFASIPGPTYTLRYENVRTVSGGCGSAQVGPGGTVILTR